MNKINFEKMLNAIGYSKSEGNTYSKSYNNVDCAVKIDFANEKIIYPEEKGLKVNDKTTCNFDKPENFVVFECINRLLEKGYRPEHIELEKKWTLGHDEKSGKADIIVYDKDKAGILCIIECKTYGREYEKAFKDTQNDGGQLFSYWQQERSCKWLVLYASDFNETDIIYKTESISCSDDNNILLIAKKDSSLLTYLKAHTAVELYEAWKETYEMAFHGDILFNHDTQSYNIGIKPLRKKDLKDFSTDDKIVNKFEEILRHNNVSDKENAFNRLIALFICKLVDEINKSEEDEVEFQYKVGTDTYESLQDRLQRLHQQGMDEFMKEKTFYIPDDYAKKLITQYTGHNRTKMIEELNNTLKILKFYTNNDFAFKDVHNEELFLQNGKVLVEVVQLFEQFRIIESNSLQLLGDLFEQLLNKGFKQNEGQFFTPIPVTRFIWKSLPISKYILSEDRLIYPKVIDYACGAGHFLTEGFEHINEIVGKSDYERVNNWEQNNIYGIEKDYRLARVSKISLFMHGAGNGNIVFGDGLESYPGKSIDNYSFDILVANPPYAVSAFKPHLKLKENTEFEVLPFISNDGSEIETLFVERISQLLKPNGLAAVVLPSTILNKENNSFIKSRETILKNFNIISIVQFGSKTFGATGTNTIVLFLQKYNEPPKRIDQIHDSIEAIFMGRPITEWEDQQIIACYCDRIEEKLDTYFDFLTAKKDYEDFKDCSYLSRYVNYFNDSNEYKNIISKKTYKSSSSEEKKAMLNKEFYKIAFAYEKDKIFFFGLVYKQRTAVVNAPSDNAEQEKFLGYKWSNRKGQEGIQIIKEGGMLFNPDDENDNNTVSAIVKNSFEGTELNSKQLDDKYFYANLADLIDFESFEFSKIIRLSKPKKKTVKSGYKIYRLSDESIFDLSIGDRILKDELEETGTIPVVSANSHDIFGYVNKEKLSNYDKDSILWGIDGDWMVDIIEKNKKFYPTDHCGVLRINSDDILPKYLMYALLEEGKNERFSRTNRASMTAIKRLNIQIPSIEKQKEIVEKIDEIDKKIKDYNDQMSANNPRIKSKFDEMFDNKNTNGIVDDIGEIGTGTTPTMKNKTYYENRDICFFKPSDFTDELLFLNKSEFYLDNRARDAARIIPANSLLVSCIGTIGKMAINGIEASCNQQINYVVLKNSSALFYFAYEIKKRIVEYAEEAGHVKTTVSILNKTKFSNIKIYIPNETEINSFNKIVEEIDKLKFAIKDNIKTLENEKNTLLKLEFK